VSSSYAPHVSRWSPSSMVLGCDYNPEQWSESVWHDDIALMREAGVTLVAINIFGWASIEPREGEYDFAALDRIIELLHAAGIQINLGTGTSSPPAWLALAHPEILPVVADGTTRWPGGRQAWCPSSPVFREAALGLASVVAQRYGSHPAVAMWHISNELGCHNALCYCDVSAAAFRRWLETRYGTIGALNDAWGTTFWSQRYGSWNEIVPPRATLSAGNPAQRVDFARFSSDELLDYYRGEADIVRSVSDRPVTTNFMVTAHIRSQNYWQWAADMDLIANDHYLDHRLAHPTTELSFAADLTRGLASGNPWMLMEQSTSAVSWQPTNVAKLPGEMLRNTMSHVARGADAICFFQWRASRQGAEKFHSAMLPHAGTDTDIWRETVALGSLLGSLDEIVGTTVEASVAIVFSWESWWAAEGDSQPSSSVKYLEQVHAAYAAARDHGVTVDIVAPGADLGSYSAVIVPSLYMVNDEDAAAIAAYVAAGGTALVTYFSGIVDETDAIRLDPTFSTPPGAFAEVVGAWTEQFFPLLPGETVSLSDGSTASIWTERVHPSTAEVVARFSSGSLEGSPAITRNSIGSGAAWYVATAPDASGYAALLGAVFADAGVVTRELPAGVEVVTRSRAGARFTFVINHSLAEITIATRGTELTTGSRCDGSLTVPAGAVAIVRLENDLEEGAK
jgi:beta-galactosidase